MKVRLSAVSAEVQLVDIQKLYMVQKQWYHYQMVEVFR
jgi:hypothetical protein